MSQKQRYYITTTLPYVNAKPHIGFALEIVQADALARYHMLLGDEVVFNTGTDEHGVKIYRKSIEEKKEPQEYCDEYAAKFDALKLALNLSYNKFIRTTDPDHIKAAQKFWTICFENGDIIKKQYKIKYCSGCELEKTDSELENERCPVHPNLELDLIDEENYFFRFEKYQEQLLKLYEKNPDFVLPENRQLEIKNFVQNGLKDFSISRLKNKMPWGVEVPNDHEHVMYVWFDALINYISTIGWPKNMEEYNNFWPGVQVAGKDNLRQQSAMWQAMLMSANLPTSKQIFIHGFINSGGQKMSKSLGNVIDPFEIVNKYNEATQGCGTDILRYYLLGGLPSYDDGDFVEEKFNEYYTAHLVNGIGNLTNRILTMVEKYCDNTIPPVQEKNETIMTLVQTSWQDYQNNMDRFQFDHVVGNIQNILSFCDQTISDQKPWEMAKSEREKELNDLLYHLCETLRHIAIMVWPIIPETAEKIVVKLGLDPAVEFAKPLSELQQWADLTVGNKINKGEVLFPRLT
ncbi:MAG: hypothetical protein A2538_04150 [Candidatus Magasanikbacteria bacterium RIFOXYD2_FULL_41_14]|uniref:methionine--tRNA ligase n=1 Tax=Candidatus Magasanikbacteria bacterium RIFOXYD2_FULL_41_14 TaxID=1798709 RepID=A0A1F6PBR9_9BACT|nr:MAG: hypothetical protein A2538_04150 [Candidatus Magasanikbacteria bacterium RIFOXYD2_FULL_41_14]